MNRILIFSLSYFPEVGGAEVAIRELTKRIPDIEFDMLTLSMRRGAPRLERVGNINVYRLGGGLGYLSKIIFVPRAFFAARKFGRSRGYQAYWLMMTYMLFPTVLLRLLGDRTPYILTLQDGDPFSRVFNRWFILPFKPLLLYGFRHATKVQAISNYLAEWARQAGFQGQVEVIPNGVSLEKFPISNLQFPKNSQFVNLITVSRLVEKNGVGDIISAMSMLPENVRLQILGSGLLESELKLKVKSLQLEHRINFVGKVPNEQIPQYLSNADIFIRPSLSEGQGISFIEAMAAGLPIIATPVGGIPDFIKDGETGLFCEVNSPQSIADKVMTYIQDPALRSRIVTQARELVRRYNWDLIASEMRSRVFSIA